MASARSQEPMEYFPGEEFGTIWTRFIHHHKCGNYLPILTELAISNFILGNDNVTFDYEPLRLRFVSDSLIDMELLGASV